MRRIAITVLIGILVLLAGCAQITFQDTDTTTTTSVDDPPAGDPPEDVIGWEDGYWHNDSIDVDQSDGLNASELDAYVSRAMARVEYIRQREFKFDVPVQVMTREQYLSQDGGSPSAAYRAWNNQVWEGLFIVGEDTDFTEALSSTRGSAVAGFYSPSNDAITVITSNADSPTIDNATLVHELVHALQDQYIILSAPKYSGRTQDEQLAANALIEGEANYIETQYTRRCGEVWTCVSGTDAGDGGDLPTSFNFGLFVTIFHPYSDGPVWVAQQVDAGGWSAIQAHYNHVPNSTEQIIHLTNESPAPISYQHRATDGWQPFPDQGVDGADTVGEASIYAMFWYQSRTYGADILDWRAISNTAGPYDTYNYSSPPSAGWGNDLLVPYHNTRDGDTEYGYVWKTVWDTERDATQFSDAYREILRTHNATRMGPGTWVIPTGPFADAYRLIRNGSTVTIVNGPDVPALDAIRSNTTTTPTTTTTTGDTGTGFGVWVAVTAVLLAGWRWTARRG